MSIEALTQIIRDVRGQAMPEELRCDMRLVDDLGLRSIELIALIARAEQAFGVKLIARRDLLGRVSTVREVLSLIEELRSERAET